MLKIGAYICNTKGTRREDALRVVKYLDFLLNPLAKATCKR
jgi:hypothetical protein